ncbi:putative pentatricopeptide repeat-containing protein At3g01580 [Selaginella moellendorffii]|uniref:putative pentatricopeptide repeat-containing protein At3g01580 n=1 Tax=Selaginella moellendorffii TaxID=88036 RepID=UPI000D1CD287|nr:putative pentatricopeptide repeat-containing protein At3g01580 [Selaginella moellendorffii]|eukprot:XP_024523754.1 putative pentatricopeptide repeat-containing protein At3g01580 [Selaginella moellendorffii]
MRSLGGTAAVLDHHPGDGLENARMDFGKHKGELMVELPDSYLAWISRRRKGRLALWAPLADRVLHERHSSTCSSSRPPGGKVLGCEEGDEVDPIDGFSLGAAVALFGWCPEISASDETSPGKDDAGRTLESDGGDILDSNERREGTDGNQEKKKSSLHHEFNKIFRKPWKNVDQGSTLSRLGKLVVELQRSGNSTARRKPRQKLYRDHDHGNSRAKRMVFSPSSKHHGDQEHHDNAKALDRLAGLVARFDSRGHKSSGCYADFIRWCGDTGAVMDGKFVHGHLASSHRKNEKFLLNLLVEMYGKWRDTLQARAVFDAIKRKNVFSWNTMLQVYVQNDRPRDAIELFRAMDLEGVVAPNKLTFFALIEAFSAMSDDLDDRDRDREIQGDRARAIRALGDRIESSGFGSDPFLATGLVNLYGKSGLVDEAVGALDRMRRGDRDVIAWTTAIAALARNREFPAAIHLFREMALEGARANNLTLLAALDACAGQRDPRSGAVIHAAAVELGFQSNAIVGTSIAHMYAKCGDLDRASAAFAGITVKDSVAWNTIIAAHVENRRPREALDLFESMLEKHSSSFSSSSLSSSLARPNAVTFMAALDACSLAEAPLGHGRSIHARIRGAGLESNVLVANSLVDMYVKCGSLGEARGVFDAIEAPTVASFTAIISGYAYQGDAEEALALFRRMQHEGIVPNHVTFVVVLFVCSHRGLIEEGWRQYGSMATDYGIAPTKEHWDCVLDLFALLKNRGGKNP